MSAPVFNRVNALDGTVVDHPSPLFEVLAKLDAELADEQRLRDENAELRCRIQELQAEDDAKAELIGQLIAERDQAIHDRDVFRAALAVKS